MLPYIYHTWILWVWKLPQLWVIFPARRNSAECWRNCVYTRPSRIASRSWGGAAIGSKRFGANWSRIHVLKNLKIFHCVNNRWKLVWWACRMQANMQVLIFKICMRRYDGAVASSFMFVYWDPNKTRMFNHSPGCKMLNLRLLGIT